MLLLSLRQGLQQWTMPGPKATSRSLDTSPGTGQWGSAEDLRERVKGWAIGTERCGIQAVPEKGFDWLLEALLGMWVSGRLIHVKDAHFCMSFTHSKHTYSRQKHFFPARLCAESWGREKRRLMCGTLGSRNHVGGKGDAYKRGQGWPWGQAEGDRSGRWEFRLVWWG